MTKTQLHELQQAANTLKALLKEDKDNINLPAIYRNTLVEAEDHYSMFLSTVERHEAGIMAHNFWNDELAQAVATGEFSKEKKYNAQINREEHGGYSLLLNEQGSDEDVLDEMSSYVLDDDAEEDIQELQKNGYQITYKK